MIIMGIDPGATKSSYVVWDCERNAVDHFAPSLDNWYVLERCRDFCKAQVMAIEQIRGYGIVAGDDTFDTCETSGRFREAHESKGGVVRMIPRKDIKRHLCGNTTTNDKYIRQALIDRFGEVGTKRQPGPLFGISGHLWAALAVAVTCADSLDPLHEVCEIAKEVGL